MKKAFVTILILCLSVTLLSGCSKSKDSGKSSSKEISGTSKNDLSFNPNDYVTLGKYTGLDAYNVTCDATDEEVEEAIEEELGENATYTDITDRAAQNKDYVTFDYSAAVDGKEVEDCTDTDYEIQLGNEEFNEAVEAEMIGKKVGESFTVDTEIPDDLSTTNAGDKGTFTIKITKIQEEDIPELNLDYVKDNTDYNSIEEYKKGVKESVISTKKSDYYDQIVQELLQNTVDNSKFKEDYPQDLYDTCEADINDSIDSNAEMFGMEREDLLANLYGMTEEDVKNEILNEVHSRLVIYAIAQKEALFLTDEEYTEYAENICEEYDYDSIEALEEECGKEMIVYQGVYDKVMSFLFDKSTKTDISEEDYEKIGAEDTEEATDAEED